jgi:hypothetical protein
VDSFSEEIKKRITEEDEPVYEPEVKLNSDEIQKK